MHHLATLTIPGEPVAASRPKVTRRGVFTPKRYRRWKRGAATVMRGQWPGSPVDAPLAVRVTAIWPRPKVRPRHVPAKDWRDGGRLRRDRLPDADNVGKAVLDAGNDAGLWADDARVWRLDVWCYYAAEGERARVVVEVWETGVLEVASA